MLITILKATEVASSLVDQIATLMDTANIGLRPVIGNQSMADNFRNGMLAGTIRDVAYAEDDGRLIGVRVLKMLTREPDMMPYGDMPLYGKHLCVHLDYRGQGVGSALVKTLNRHAFGCYGISRLYGCSTEIRALRLYGALGALLYVPDIQQYTNPILDSALNLRSFLHLIGIPAMKPWVLQNDIHYAWPSDDNAVPVLRSHGFSAIKDIAATVAMMPVPA